MKYSEFLNYVKEHIVDELGENENYSVEVNRVNKNNAVVLDGIIIKKDNDLASPTIYLNSYYEQYLDGRPIKPIIRDIADKFLNCQPINIVSENILDFEKIKSNIVVRIVNLKSNKKQLKECPHIEFHDLAITFRWLAHYDDIGIGTALISNKEFEKWHISKEELFNIAIENTKKYFPEKIDNMKDVLKDFIDQEEITDINDEIALYILTNQMGINGATCMLYNDALVKFAALMNNDLYILPSSIHEGATRFAA